MGYFDQLGWNDSFKCIIEKKKAGIFMAKGIKKLLVNTALLAAGTMASVVLYDRIIEKKEKSIIQNYGFKVETQFGSMNVVIHGEKGPTIVLLSGYGTASPYLDFKPLIKELSRFAKVVTLEYPGYGFSEQTERPRTVWNIIEEVHAVLKQMNFEHYWLMPHSISGVYSLAYANHYPNEVEGILCIDTSHPEQIDYMGVDAEIKVMPVLKELGITRLMDQFMSGKLTPNNEDYDADELKQLKAMNLSHDSNPTLVDEGKRLAENMNACRKLKLPQDLPVLMFVSQTNVEMLKDWWKELHEKQISETQYGKMIIMEGTHYLHWTKSAEMAEEAKKFIFETLERK